MKEIFTIIVAIAISYAIVAGLDRSELVSQDELDAVEWNRITVQTKRIEQ